MCGIAGFLDFSRDLPGDAWQVVLARMGEAISHRGPDDAGTWTDVNARVGLVHRRLSILDLSPAGHQPMISKTGRYIVVFNGEIYNHIEIRDTIQIRHGYVSNWRGHSDTETLLAGFDVWGIAETVGRAIGMFAFAVWDRSEQTLTLCRDRLGEKPLYYGWQGDTFLFGSELKALKIHPAFRAEIDRNSLALFMRHNYIPAPYSIYKDIHKLLPGTLVTISLRSKLAIPQHYWDARKAIAEGITQPFKGTETNAIDALDALLRDAVSKQMMADVPLGAFLSGGVDSTAIVALMQAQSVRPVKTFTIGFNEESYNEAEHAKITAMHLGTDHTELYVTPRQAMDVVARLPTLYDEPFSDPTQIPNFLVSQIARQQVKVTLSGDAGDELFGGYSRYTLTPQIWNRLSRFPVSIRRVLAKALNVKTQEGWNLLFESVQHLLPKGLFPANIGEKLLSRAAIMSAKTGGELYHHLVSHWNQPADVVLGAMEKPTVMTSTSMLPQTDHFVHQMMALDLLTYLPDDILVKVDRAAMGVSLETRVPMLDHRVVEFAWSLPLNMKIRNGQGKWILRQVLYRYVPKEMMERPKKGFSVPIDSWLRGPLREWAESLLDEVRLSQEGFLNPVPIRQKWNEHLSGRRNWQNHLWDVLMFQAWLEHERPH